MLFSCDSASPQIKPRPETDHAKVSFDEAMSGFPMTVEENFQSFNYLNGRKQSEAVEIV